MITDNLSPEELAFFVSMIAINLCNGRKKEEIELVATLYSSIASQMFLILEQKDYLNKKNGEASDNNVSVTSESANIPRT